MPAKGQRRKQQIIDTAKKMFIENGFQSTHIGQVCENLSIARGTVYQYFGNKREIIYSILESVEEEIEDIFDLDDLIDFLNKEKSREEIIKFIHKRFIECIKIVIEEAILIKLIYKEIMGIDRDITNRLYKFFESITKILRKDINELKNRGIYKEEIDPDVSAKSFFGIILYLIYEYNQRGKSIFSSQLVDKTIKFYLHGIV